MGKLSRPNAIHELSVDRMIADQQAREAARRVRSGVRPLGYGDFFLHVERNRREHDLTAVAGLCLALFCMGACMVAFYGTVHPIMAKLLAIVLRFTH